MNDYLRFNKSQQKKTLCLFDILSCILVKIFFQEKH